MFNIFIHISSHLFYTHAQIPEYIPQKNFELVSVKNVTVVMKTVLLIVQMFLKLYLQIFKVWF